MTMCYSSTTNGFYDDDYKSQYEAADSWPDDAVQVTDEVYQALMKGQEEGRVIAADSSGAPVLEDVVIDYNAKVESTRSSLLTTAKSTISLWQSELLLGTISDDDKESLTEWITYIKALNALDFTAVTDENSYNSISWPDEPGSE